MSTAAFQLSFRAFLIVTTAALPLSAHSADSPTVTTSTPSRGDALAKGDKIILQSDAPIFRLEGKDGGDSTTIYCAPSRTQLVIESTPVTTTNTVSKSSSQDGKAPATKTTSDGSATTVETTAAAAGDTTSTTTKTTATAVIVRSGGKYYLPLIGEPPQKNCVLRKPASKKDAGKSGADDQAKREPPMFETVQKGPTYTFDPADLQRYNFSRYGLTYGIVVVPTKVMVADRAFISSSSVLPYVGLEQWGPSWAGALVFAAGVGTAPASTQASGGGTQSGQSGGTQNTSSQSTNTKATFSVATGIVGTLGGGVFKVGFLVGVDTAGSRTGFKYQGKPWIGISLGAGTQ